MKSWIYFDPETNIDTRNQMYKLPSEKFILTEDTQVYYYDFDMNGIVVDGPSLPPGTINPVGDITTLDANAEWVSRIMIGPKPGDKWGDPSAYIYLMCCKKITVTTHYGSYDINVLSSIQYINLANIAGGIIAKIDPPVPTVGEDEVWVNARSIQLGNFVNGAVDEFHIICAGGYRDDHGGVGGPYNTADYATFYYDITNGGWTTIWEYNLGGMNRGDYFFSESVLLIYDEGSTEIKVIYFRHDAIAALNGFKEIDSTGITALYTFAYDPNIADVDNPTVGIVDSDGMIGSDDARGTYGLLATSPTATRQYVMSYRKNYWWHMVKLLTDADKVRKVDWKGGCFRNDTTGSMTRGTIIKMTTHATMDYCDISIHELCNKFNSNYSINERSSVNWWTTLGVDYGCARTYRSDIGSLITALATDLPPLIIETADFSKMNVRQALNDLAIDQMCLWKRPFFDTVFFIKRGFVKQATGTTLDNSLYKPDFNMQRNKMYTGVRIVNDFGNNDLDAIFALDVDNRITLTVNSRFIHPAAADEIGEKYLDFFGTIRRVWTIRGFFLIEYEILDGLTLRFRDKDNNLKEDVDVIVFETSYNDITKDVQLLLIEKEARKFTAVIPEIIGVGGIG